jgi:hypothetical protein
VGRVPATPYLGRPSRLETVKLSDDMPEDEFWFEKRRARRQEASDTFGRHRGLSKRARRKKGALKCSYDQVTAENTVANEISWDASSIRLEDSSPTPRLVEAPRLVRFAFDVGSKPKTS